MRVSESIVERLPALALLEDNWEPVSQTALVAWLLFYGIVLLGAVGSSGLASWLDLVFVPIHEGGHLLFGWVGSHWLMVAGGTLLQLFVPFALAVYFTFRRQLPGTAFCAFFFFEQLLPVGTYIADSRSQSLDYVTVGDPELAEHDWAYLLPHAGILSRYADWRRHSTSGLGWNVACGRLVDLASMAMANRDLLWYLTLPQLRCLLSCEALDDWPAPAGSQESYIPVIRLIST